MNNHRAVAHGLIDRAIHALNRKDYEKAQWLWSQIWDELIQA